MLARRNGRIVRPLPRAARVLLLEALPRQLGDDTVLCTRYRGRGLLGRKEERRARSDEPARTDDVLVKWGDSLHGFSDLQWIRGAHFVQDFRHHRLGCPGHRHGLARGLGFFALARAPTAAPSTAMPPAPATAASATMTSSIAIAESGRKHVISALHAACSPVRRPPPASAAPSPSPPSLATLPILAILLPLQAALSVVPTHHKAMGARHKPQTRSMTRCRRYLPPLLSKAVLTFCTRQPRPVAKQAATSDKRRVSRILPAALPHSPSLARSSEKRVNSNLGLY